MKRIGLFRTKTLQAAVCVSAMAMVTAPAATLAQVGVVETQMAQGERRTFDIPPQPLSTALVVFGQQAGRQVTADGALLRGVTTPGVQGSMTVEQALRQLLSGTGLTYSGIGGATISLHQAGLPPGVMQLDPVQVQGYPVPPQAMIDNLPPPYAGGQVATGGQLGLLGNRDVMDTPFNQTNYTAKKAQDQQATTVRDVLMDDPSVRFSGRDGGPVGDLIWSRGFQITSENQTYGGLYGILPSWTTSVELAERIELLKGPSAMLNGMPPLASNGGTLNIVPKRAPDGGLTQATTNYASAGQFGGHIDLARRFGPENQFGARFNGVFKAGPTEVQWNSDQRALAVLGLDFRGERTRLSADLGYQNEYIGGMIPWLSLSAGVPVPWAPDARKNFGQPWGFVAYKDLFGVVRAEVDITDRITAYAAFGAHDNRAAQFIVANRVVVTNFNGNSTATPQNFSMYNTYFTAEGGVRGLVDTGPIGHEFALTVTTFGQTTGAGSVLLPAIATNIYNPTIVAQPSAATPAANKISSKGLSSFGFADTLSAADKRIQLTAGARLQYVTADNFNATTGVRTSSYDQNALSPSVALVFKPWQNVSVYGNWIQGLEQGITVGAGFANAGEVFPPYKSTQYEAGVKVDWGKFTTTASVFQISQPSLITNVATNTLVLNGEQRNQGLELNVFGEPMDGVRLLGGAMFLDPILIKTARGATDGWIAPMTPTFQLNLAGEWDLPLVQGLTLNGRVIYTGSQYIDTTWPRRSLAAWTRFDLGARYTFENPGAKGKLLVARLNVENVLDAGYWAGGGGVGQLILGTPRTFRVSLSADF